MRASPTPCSARAGPRPRASASASGYKLRPRESFSSFPLEEGAFLLREQTNCGHAESHTTSGLVAYLDTEPVGWCAVEPRSAYPGLVRVCRVPWQGRAEDRSDDTVWAVTCVFTRAGFRRRGISYALAWAAVDFARERGARAVQLKDRETFGDGRCPRRAPAINSSQLLWTSVLSCCSIWVEGCPVFREIVWTS